VLRVAIIIGLFLSLAFLVRGIASSFKETGYLQSFEKTEKSVQQQPLPPVRLQHFYPPVPKKLPDLKKGYVFNETRSLVEEQSESDAVPDIKGPNVKIEDISYAGSIKTAKFHKALISYPTPKEEKAPAENQPPAARGQVAPLTNKQLEMGEVFSGYKVVAIEADKLVFEKGGKKTEKFLYDPKKERLKAPELPKPQKAVAKPPSRATAARQSRSVQGRQTSTRPQPTPTRPTVRPRGTTGTATQQRNPFVIPQSR
jgi:hypothetical protein